MSYDLYFKARDQNAKSADFPAYFRERTNYEVTDKQAVYENETTGVYFIFDFGEVGDDEQPELLPVSLNLNYVRPHIFGLEAEPEVRNFLSRFELAVFDPQVDGMSDGVFETEGFLRGWNKGNELGYRAILEQNPDEPVLTLPTKQIEACWRWNLAREALQQDLGEEVFVPRFMFVAHGGAVKTAIVWPDGIPTALPEAEVVIIPRKDILPRRFFRSVEDMVIADWADVEEIVSEFPIKQAALAYRSLNYSEVPNAVLSRLRAFAATREKPEGISVDKILNTELVEKVRGR